MVGKEVADPSWKANFRTKTNGTMDGIVGMIKMVLALNETAEWLPCDGRALSTADYPALYELIGYRFGGELGQFQLPNLPPQQSAYFMIKVRPAMADANFEGMVAQIVLWAGDKVPTNWMSCDGRLIEGSDYPTLQKVAAAGQNGVLLPSFHLPIMQAESDLQYIICVKGIDPSPTAVVDDDDL
jgi:microcystin-dependent protein